MNRRHVLSGFGGTTVAAVTGAVGCGTVRANATAPAPPNQPPGTLRWRFQATPGDEPVIIATDSTVYASGAGQSSGNCRTYAIDASAGKLIWQTPASGPRPYATGRGVVYGFTVTGGNVTSVVATSATTGRTRWTHDAGRMLDNAKAGWLDICRRHGVLRLRHHRAEHDRPIHRPRPGRPDRPPRLVSRPRRSVPGTSGGETASSTRPPRTRLSPSAPPPAPAGGSPRTSARTRAERVPHRGLQGVACRGDTGPLLVKRYFST